jgi:predicted nucleotide-binding protein
VELTRKLEVLDKQILDALDGFPTDFTHWRMETKVALRAVVGDKSPLVQEFDAVRYTSQISGPGFDSSGYRPAGVRKVIAILKAAKSELQLLEELAEVSVVASETPDERSAALRGALTFIIHGHDDAHKHELFRVLHDITGAKPIILHEQPSGGRSIFEKLEAYAATAGFAVALLTADDVGRAKGTDLDLPRARQNVVFEAGYFAGRIGRARVVLLHEAGVELPGDLDGIVYVPLDNPGAWKMKLAHEMASVGVAIDWGGLAGQ